MYNGHFGLTTAPFRITPDTRRFFGGGQRAEILDTLVYAITSGEGMVKVTGEVGTGKTMLCRMLQEQLPDSVEVVYVANPSLTADEILTAIACELGLRPAGDSHLQLQQRLQAHLLQAHRQGRQVVVFIEEAQRMPLETLEEIRLLSNLETRQAKLLQLVLFGQPELDQLLEKHEIRQLRDRISHCFELKPLNAQEVRDYIRFRLHSAGYRGNELFTWPACRQLALSSGGLIRRIHVLTDKALLAAFAAGEQRVRWQHVWRARRDNGSAWPRLRGTPAKLGAGLATGALLAVAGMQFAPHAGPPPLAQAAVATGPIRQDLDEMRAAAVQLQPAAGMPLVGRRLQASRDWLQAPDAGGLTIQLLLTEDDDLATVEKLLKKQAYNQLLPELYLYRSEVAGRQRWNLLYGEFDSKTKALAALAELPEGIQRHQPFLRSLAALRKARQGAGGGTDKEGHG